MPVAWRIVREQRSKDAFTGEGARLGGGRWNSPGTAMVYASAHKSLAALELLAHVNASKVLDLVSFRIEWTDVSTEIISEDILPKEWSAQPPHPITAEIGDRWAREQRSVLLVVPSVIVPDEYNYLINPAHADFQKLKIGPAQTFNLDHRLQRLLP